MGQNQKTLEVIQREKLKRIKMTIAVCSVAVLMVIPVISAALQNATPAYAIRSKSWNWGARWVNDCYRDWGTMTIYSDGTFAWEAYVTSTSGGSSWGLQNIQFEDGYGGVVATAMDMWSPTLPEYDPYIAQNTGNWYADGYLQFFFDPIREVPNWFDLISTVTLNSHC